MKTIIYLLQVSACTGIFYAFYFLLLRRLTFFTLNRWYLVGTLLLNFIIPAINLPVSATQSPAIMQPVMLMNKMQVIEEPLTAIQFASKQTIEHHFDWVQFAQMLYLAIAVISIIHLLFTLLVFARRMKNKELMQIGNVKVLRGNKTLGNSSFLNVIFINDDELEPGEIKQVIAHELLHVKLMHSADRLLARLVLIALWFNPFAYWYIRSIEENHEFEVDRIAAGEADKSMYATLLFKLSVSGQSYLMHSFSKVPLKSRIAMLFNKPTSNMKKIIYALVLPVVALSCLAFANLETKNRVTKNLIVKKVDTTVVDTNISINKYHQIDRLRGKRNPYPYFAKSPEYIKSRKIASRIANKIVTYKITGVTSNDVNTGVKLPHGYTMTNEGDEFVLSTLYGPRNQLDGKLNIGDEVQVTGMSIALVKKAMVVVMAENITKDGVLIYKINPEDKKDTTAFGFEGNRVRYMYGKITDIQKYPNGKLKSAVVVKENGYRVKFTAKPTAPAFTSIKEGDDVTFRFVHEYRTGPKQFDVKDWVALSNDIKDYGTKNPDFFLKFYEKI